MYQSSDPVQHGGPAAESREAMIKEHLPLVRYHARRLANVQSTYNGLQFEDLVAHGVIGLIQSVDRWDPRQGVAFHSFAAPRIRGAMIDAIRAGDHLPRTARQRVAVIDRAAARLSLELEREPTAQEVREKTGLNPDQYRESLAAKEWSVTSLEKTFQTDLEGGGYQPAADLPEPSSRLEEESLWASITAAVSALPERERVLLSLVYKEELSRLEVAEVMGISQTRVSQLHGRAIARIQSHPAVREQAA